MSPTATKAREGGNTIEEGIRLECSCEGTFLFSDEFRQGDES